MLRGLEHLSYERAAGAGPVLSRVEKAEWGMSLMHIDISKMGAKRMMPDSFL